MADRPTPRECANCGAEIPPAAKACPECGADERTGWRETSVYDDLDLPESAYENDDDVANRSGKNVVNGIAWYWWMAGVALIILLIAGAVALR